MKKIILTLISASMLFACTGSKTDNNNDNDSDSTAIDSAEAFVIDSASYIKKSHVDKKDAKSPQYTIQHSYQFLTGGTEATDSINASICQNFISTNRKTDIAAELKIAGNKLVDQYTSELKQMYREGDENDMEYESQQQGVFLSDCREGILSYRMTMYAYQGGAHGSSEVFYLNFNRSTGHLLTIDDVFNKAFENDILHYMEKQLLADNACITRNDLMEKTGFLTLGELYLTNNFLLGSDAVTFHFGQYEIGPYSSGMVDITVPYSELEQFMVKE